MGHTQLSVPRFLTIMVTLTETARIIFTRALADCSAEAAVARHVAVHSGMLHINGEVIALRELNQIRIVAAGKAATPMLRAVLRQLPRPLPCDVGGVLIAPAAPPRLPAEFADDRFLCYAGGHPTPNAASRAGAAAALDTVRAAALEPAQTLCLFLISGGASSMMELPLDPTISLTDTAEFHRALVASGATIAEINCVRKHFSAVKGGRLAQAAGNARRHSLLISDVPAGHEDALGSGPTLPDSSTVAECQEILARYQLPPRFPACVRRFFQSDELIETPKPAELCAPATVVLSSSDLAQAAARHAHSLGWTAVIDNRCDEWDYKDAAKYLLHRLRILRQTHARVCLVSVGEVIVRLPPNSPIGTGGRNQQFALYAATLLEPRDGSAAVLSAGSDGIDGNSPAAGAVIDVSCLKDPTAEFPPAAALASFDTYRFFAARNATIVTGPTGSNLRDLRLLLA